MNLALLIVLMERELSNIFGKYQDFAMRMIKILLIYLLIKKFLAEVVVEVNIKIKIIFVNIVRMVISKNLKIFNLIKLSFNVKFVRLGIMLQNWLNQVILRNGRKTLRHIAILQQKLEIPCCVIFIKDGLLIKIN